VEVVEPVQRQLRRDDEHDQQDPRSDQPLDEGEPTVVGDMLGAFWTPISLSSRSSALTRHGARPTVTHRVHRWAGVAA
jgi:hypothetical protein